MENHPFVHLKEKKQPDHNLKGVSSTAQGDLSSCKDNYCHHVLSEVFVPPLPPGISRQCCWSRNSKSACQVFKPGLQLDGIYKRIWGEVLTLAFLFKWVSLFLFWECNRNVSLRHLMRTVCVFFVLYVSVTSTHVSFRSCFLHQSMQRTFLVKSKIGVFHELLCSACLRNRKWNLTWLESPCIFRSAINSGKYQTEQSYLACGWLVGL